MSKANARKCKVQCQIWKPLHMGTFQNGSVKVGDKLQLFIRATGNVYIEGTVLRRAGRWGKTIYGVLTDVRVWNNASWQTVKDFYKSGETQFVINGNTISVTVLQPIDSASSRN